MHPVFVGILTCVLVVLAAAFFPPGLPILGIILIAIAWRNFLKQSEQTARTQADMDSDFDRGVTYAEQGEYQQAINKFNTVLEQPPRMLRKFPNVAEAYFNRGGAHYLMGNLVDALQDYDQAIDRNPRYAAAYISRGPVLAEKENYEAALNDYQTAIQLTYEQSPDLPIVYYNLGNAYKILGEDEKALESYSHAVCLNPNYVYAYTAQGLVYAKLENYPQTIECFSRVIQLQQENIGESPGLSRLELKNEDAFYHRGEAYFYQGDYVEAIEDFTQVIQLNPEIVSAYEYRGMAHCYFGNNPEALEDFAHVAELEPSANTHYNQAITQYLMGRLDDALATVSEVLKLDNTVTPAYYFRWNLCYDIDNQQVNPDDLQQAETLEAEQTDTIYKDDAHGFYQRGLARYRTDNPQGAVTDMEKVMQICQRLQYATFYQKAEQLLTEIQHSTEF